MMRSTSSRGPAPSAWNMALCSQSTGSTVAPAMAARRMNRPPAQTRHSLLASATVAPRSIAASVGFSPAAPVIAAITQSAGRCAASSRPPSPAAASIPLPAKRVLQFVVSRRIGDHGESRADLARDLRQRRRIAPRADRLDAISFRRALDQIDRAGADRTGSAENGDAAHFCCGRRLSSGRDRVTVMLSPHQQTARGRIETAAREADQTTERARRPRSRRAGPSPRHGRE